MAADWSGARQGEQRHLWIAEYDTGTQSLEQVRGATRQQATDLLLDLVSAQPEVVIGLDFGFSLPAWWMERCGISGVDELWADGDRLESWLRDCPRPFWGRPGRRRPVLADEADHWRWAERSLRPRPRSMFQIGGAGAVGTASLRGMPTLARLRAAGVAIWPFDPWTLPVAVEVWPRLAIGAVIKSDASARARWLDGQADRIPEAVRAHAEVSDDAFDAVAAALALADRNGIARPNTVHPIVGREGWIDGVPLPFEALTSP